MQVCCRIHPLLQCKWAGPLLCAADHLCLTAPDEHLFFLRLKKSQNFLTRESARGNASCPNKNLIYLEMVINCFREL